LLIGGSLGGLGGGHARWCFREGYPGALDGARGVGGTAPETARDPSGIRKLVTTL
jgi:hypothetical protein